MPTFKVVSVNSNKVLEVAGGSMENGAQVQQWDATGAENQAWIFNKIGNISHKDVYEITCQLSSKKLDVEAGSLENGARIIQWDATGGGNQLWYVIQLEGDIHIIQSVASLKVLDVAGFSHENGAPVHQWENFHGSNQQWRLIQLD